MENPQSLTPFRHTDLNVKINGEPGSAGPDFPTDPLLQKDHRDEDEIKVKFKDDFKVLAALAGLEKAMAL